MTRIARSNSGAPGQAPFEGRTVHLVSDLTLHEQLYLYEKTRLLKAKETGCDADPKRKLLGGCTDPLVDFASASDTAKCVVYLIFCEESTRTKDSFRNAATYHGMDVNEISNAKGLFKKETVADVVKMLASYSTKKSLFIIRSPMEGVCRWLESAMQSHFEAPPQPCGTPALTPTSSPLTPPGDERTKKTKIRAPIPSFLNAGDGRHTHPTLEFVDVFTLLEINGFDRSEIHIALVGDLQNGRTAHSKVDGLKIFDKVTVDLIAPEDIQYPVEYRAKMESNGFNVRSFSTIDEYFCSHEAGGNHADPTSPGIAKVWSFSRLQMGRIGEEARGKEDALYDAVVFKPEWKERLPKGARFLQTLPRDPKHPLVPFEFDFDDTNAYELASSNGYWVRITLLAMVQGLIGSDFVPQSPKPTDLVPPILGGNPFDADFVNPVEVQDRESSENPCLPFDQGVVIDHIMRGATKKECWSSVESMRKVMGWLGLLGSQGVYTQSSEKITKGVISLPGFAHGNITTEALKKLAAMSPGCTVNLIQGAKVVGKYRLSTPPRIFNISNVQCQNVRCVSHEDQNQPDVRSDFLRVPFYVTSALKCQVPAHEVRLKGQFAALNLETSLESEEAPLGEQPSPRSSSGHYLFVCRYCMWPHFYRDIWQ